MTTSDAGGFEAGGGNINSTNGVFQVPENIQIIGNPNLSYDERLRLGYQNSTNIPPHLMRWNGVWDLPFGRGQKWGSGVSRLTDALIGGWQIAGIGEWRSGYWRGIASDRYLFGDPTLSSDERLELTFGGRRQVLYFAGDFNPALATDVDQAKLQAIVPLDRAQRLVRPYGPNFDNRTPQTMADGTVRQTSITEMVNWNSRAFYLGPSAFGTDLSVFKNFTITERFRLRFATDFFNAFNHPINNPTPNAQTGMVDLSTQFNEPRIIQFSLRLNF
jgi:hypothetical protein